MPQDGKELFGCSRFSIAAEKIQSEIPPAFIPQTPFCGRQISRGFAKSFPPENSFGKTESAFRPATLPEYLEGRTPKEKTPFPFSKCIPPAKSEMQGVFFLSGLPSEARRWRGFRGAYDLGQSHHALRAWHIIRGSAGNESELFGIMTTS